ncbi:YcjX family protein [Escherichia coli]|uniref:YcjX family protein n=1 Tax=Escherichia coli TaxID=562 RepID=UPI003CC90A33
MRRLKVPQRLLGLFLQATTSGIETSTARKIPALRGNRLAGAPLTVYPGEVPARLPGQAFWDKQGFQFEAFQSPLMDVDKPLPHIKLDAQRVDFNRSGC